MDKPIKRHPALVKLSKDHHFGLLLGWKVKKGINNNIDASRIANYILAFADAELLPHFNEEEEDLFSLLSSADNMRLRAEAEHAGIKQWLRQLKAGDYTLEDLVSFTEELSAHIRFEERQLFPYIEAHQNFETYINAVIAHTQHTRIDFDAQWPDHFWK